MLLHSIDLINRQIEHIELPCESTEQICSITGEMRQCIPIKYLFGSKFTNHDILKIKSGFVSIEAYQALKWKWERYSSWIVTENEIKLLGKSHAGENWRKEIINYIYQPPNCLWAGYITTSYKKHGALRTPVNGNSNIWLFEMDIVNINISKFDEYYHTLLTMLKYGFGRPVLETLRCSAHIMKKCGFAEWFDFQVWALDKYKSPLYKFVCYLLPPQSELKNEKVFK